MQVDLLSMTLHCPICGSTSVTYKAGGYGGMVYRCKECGYTGSFVVEAGDDFEDDIKAAESDEERFQAPEGKEERFRIPLWAKILAILFVFVVILYII